MKCDNCDNEATVNYQRELYHNWLKYDILPNGDYGKPIIKAEQEPTDDNNLHLCDSCEQKWLDGEL